MGFKEFISKGKEFAKEKLAERERISSKEKKIAAKERAAYYEQKEKSRVEFGRKRAQYESERELKRLKSGGSSGSGLSMFGQGALGMFSAQPNTKRSLDVFGGGAPRGLSSPMAGGAFSGVPRGATGMHNPFGGGSMFGSTEHIKRKVKHRKRRF